MNVFNFLYAPDRKYIYLEVFIGPQVPTDESGAAYKFPIFVNHVRVGELDTSLADEIEFQKDVQLIRTKKVSEGGVERTLSREVFQEVGEKLFRSLFREGDELKDVYEDRLTKAREREVPLRLNLCFDPLELPPELALAPWEYLFDPDDKLFLAASEEIAFSRRVPTTEYAEPHSVSEPLRILVTISNPSDLKEIHPELKSLDVDEERDTIERALRDCKHVEVEFVPDPPSPVILDERFESFKPNIFHFIGHGVRRGGHPQLVMANDDNRVLHYNANQLRELLPVEHDLKVVFLSACQSGETRIDSGEPTEDSSWDEADLGKSLVGIAPELLAGGIPAVLAMQYSVRVDTARHFASKIYKRLADEEDPIDVAVNRARRDLLLTAGNRRDFGTPVLHTLIPRLFTVDLGALQRLVKGRY